MRKLSRKKGTINAKMPSSGVTERCASPGSGSTPHASAIPTATAKFLTESKQ